MFTTLQLIELDPTNWVWHYLMCSRTRFLRRSHGDYPSPRSHPWPQELEAALSAIKHSNDMSLYQLMSIAQLSQCLAEIVRAKTESRDFSPTRVGDKKYANLEEIVEQINDAAGYDEHVN